MHPAYEIRSNSDGSPNFDFYRRRAVWERRRKRRALMKRYGTIGVLAMKSSVSAIQISGRSSLVLRASAGIVLIVAIATFNFWATAQ
jgi:hypothetical protein